MVDSRFPLQKLFNQLEKEGISINFASLIGHNTIRHEVMGDEDRIPTSEELSFMQELVQQEMMAGAIGLSTGLAYVPGRYSTTEEIIELVKKIKLFNGVYTTHLRNQGRYIKEAIEEAIYIGDEQLDFLASLKSKEELVADIVLLLQSPITNVLSALQSGGNKMAGIIKTLSEKN